MYREGDLNRSDCPNQQKKFPTYSLSHLLAAAFLAISIRLLRPLTHRRRCPRLGAAWLSSVRRAQRQDGAEGYRRGAEGDIVNLSDAHIGGLTPGTRISGIALDHLDIPTDGHSGADLLDTSPEAYAAPRARQSRAEAQLVASV